MLREFSHILSSMMQLLSVKKADNVKKSSAVFSKRKTASFFIIVLEYLKRIDGKTFNKAIKSDIKQLAIVRASQF